MREPTRIYITRAEVLMGGNPPLSTYYEDNLRRLLLALNKFRAAYGKPMVVTSGFRTMEDHIRIYREIAAKAGRTFDITKVPMRSPHLSCEACDFRDSDGALDAFCQANIPLLEQLGLYLEHPEDTPGWCHLDIRPRNNRIFKP